MKGLSLNLKMSRKWLIIIVAFILIFLSMIIASYFSSLKIKEDQFQNWGTYESDNIPYVFKYPKNTRLTEEDSVLLTLWGPNDISQSVALRFLLPKKIKNKTLVDYVKDDLKQKRENIEVIKTLEAIEVNNLAGYAYTIKRMGFHRFLYLQSENNVVSIIYSKPDSASRDFSEFDKTVELILSTFEVTE